MKVVIDGIRYYTLDDIKDQILKAISEEKKDYDNADVLDAIGWVEHSVILKFQEIKRMEVEDADSN